MKHLKIAVIALFTLVAFTSVNAQDSNNPWGISFGLNTVDLERASDNQKFFKDYVGTEDWNTLPAISRLAVTRYLEKGFSLQLAGSLNKVTKERVYTDEMYYALDLNVQYDLSKFINSVFGGTSKHFNPYIYLGGGYTSIANDGEGMLNTGIGFNLWFTENLGLNIQSGVKTGFSDKVAEHIQHSLGLILKFGGVDTDGDGIYDKEDACPEVAGLEAFNGCPDTDGDGIQDGKDACPTVAGLAALNGCPDADEDGIADKDDMCPNEKGSAANRGCPDTDSDGVVNKDDKCPNVAGPSQNGGCPWPDTDGDGVLDKDDNCDNEAGPASNNGCPEPIITEAAVKSIALNSKDILFNLEETSFKAGVEKRLDAIAVTMNEFPKASFSIEGHTDTTGSEKGNAKLSQNRANTVKAYFVGKGVDAARLTAKGFGAEKPSDSNKTRAGRENNRRVEIKVVND